MALTPPIRTIGRYVLKTPWVASSAKVYECEAIRSFDDLSQLGVDIYEEFYASQGLINGEEYGGVVFSFESERQKDPNIITLRAQDGEYIYVPDTYILSYPNMSGVKYSNMVISANLGPLPDFLDLSALKTELGDFIAQFIGVTPTLNEHRADSTNQPTPVQHDILESARLAAISIYTTHYVELQQERAKTLKLTQTVDALTEMLVTAGVIPS